MSDLLPAPYYEHELRFKRDTEFRKQFFVPNSFAHPAKMDAQLLIWIVEHYTELGQTLLDPMFGSGTTMLACTLGRHVIGVELEQKFVDMAKQNWEKVQQKPQLGYAMGDCTILLGDARNLPQVLCDAVIKGLQISRHSDIIKHDECEGKTASGQSEEASASHRERREASSMVDGQLSEWRVRAEGGSRTSGLEPSGDSQDTEISGDAGEVKRQRRQIAPELAGRLEEISGGELANPTDESLEAGQLPVSDMRGSNRPSASSDTLPNQQGQFIDQPTESVRSMPRQSNCSNPQPSPQDSPQALQTSLVDCVISSPPYAEVANASKNTGSNLTEAERKALAGKRTGEIEEGMRYSKDPGNIGNLPYGRIDAILTSPPYEGSISDQRDIITSIDASKSPDWHPGPYSQVNQPQHYGHEGNIGNLKADSYLQAMLTVYQNCLAVLRDGGLLILVVKNFVRQMKEVDLRADTVKLAEQAGFTFLEEHYRKLTQQSFWRILYARKYPDGPVIDKEYVLAFRKVLL